MSNSHEPQTCPIAFLIYMTQESHEVFIIPNPPGWLGRLNHVFLNLTDATPEQEELLDRLYLRIATKPEYTVNPSSPQACEWRKYLVEQEQGVPYFAMQPNAMFVITGCY